MHLNSSNLVGKLCTPPQSRPEGPSAPEASLYLLASPLPARQLIPPARLLCRGCPLSHFKVPIRGEPMARNQLFLLLPFLLSLAACCLPLIARQDLTPAAGTSASLPAPPRAARCCRCCLSLPFSPMDLLGLKFPLPGSLPPLGHKPPGFKRALQVFPASHLFPCTRLLQRVT